MILIVDDDYSITASLGLLLKQAGFETMSAETPAKTLALVREHRFELVLQDMNFSRSTTGEEGLRLLQQIRAEDTSLPVILITAWGSIGLAVEGMKNGAADFITKPWSNQQVLQSIQTALGVAAQTVDEEIPPSRERLEANFDLRGVVGKDPAFLSVLDLVLRVASTEASILLTGETGTGKEVLAEAVHRNSPRRKNRFVKVNLGGVPATLFESEMFGHVRGAFTDAHQDREGWFAAARGGTILLDEIGDLDASCQVKLLRVLQDRRFQRLGTSRDLELDVRVISATNVDLQEAIRAGTFREDLFYRINLINVRVPSLQERSSDIPLLARHFLRDTAQRYGKAGVTLDKAAEVWLQSRPWPGNVRQLQHIVERTLLLSSGSALGVSDFGRTLQMESGEDADDQLPVVGTMTMEEIEQAMIRKSLKHHDGNLSRVAESLGMSRAALYRRLEKYGIDT